MKIRGRPLSTPKMKNEDALIENFVSLQHVLTNLAEKLNKLSENIADLISIFTQAAKSFEENQPQADTELINKIEAILEQNKIIARGISIIEERTRGQGSRQLPRL